MRRTMIATLAAIALIAACNEASNKAEDAKLQNERRDEGANQPMPASVDALKHLNPAFSGDTIEVGAASYLMLPASHAEQFRLASHGAPKETAPTGSTRIASLDGKAVAPRHHHQTHVVSPGESLWQIAREYSTNVSHLQQLNHLHGDAIQPGQVLQLDDVD